MMHNIDLTPTNKALFADARCRNAAAIIILEHQKSMLDEVYKCYMPKAIDSLLEESAREITIIPLISDCLCEDLNALH